MATADLGGLGAKEGPGVTYYWAPPSLMPLFIPWLVTLGLLLLGQNRAGAAWWVWLPVISLYACAQLLILLPFIGNSEITDMFSQTCMALTFGLGGLWLVAPKLSTPYRFMTFLLMAVSMAAISACAFFLRFGWESDQSLLLGGIVAVSLASAVIAFALVVAGRMTRRRYHPLLLTVAVLGSLGVGWLLFLFPFMIYELGSAGPSILLPYFAGAGIFSGISFAWLLPFLLLSFASSFYRERLVRLLKVETAPLPPPLLVEPVSIGTTSTL